MRQYLYITMLLAVLAHAAHGLTWKASEAANAPMLSGGNLHRIGEVSEFVSIPNPGKYKLSIEASGRAVDDIWPVMSANVDGLCMKTVSVDSGDKRAYAFELELEAGVVTIGAMLLNESPALLDPRAILLDSFELRGANGEEPAKATAAAWIQSAQAREQKAIDAADTSIARVRTGDATVRVVDVDGKPMAGAKVRVKQTRHAFLFGCNIAGFEQFHDAIKDGNYARQFADLFNYATVPLYWKLFEPVEGQSNYKYVDGITAWCKSKGMAMKGHPLLWNDKFGIPMWSKEFPGAEKQKTRVTEVMEHYRERMKYWEVVNEPANHPGIALDAPHKWARAAAPDAELIVNEYGIFYCGHPPFYELLADAAKRKVPFDAVGIQAHAPPDMAFPLDRVWRVLDRYAALGKTIHITEFTPPSAGGPIAGAIWRGQWTEAAQADYAEQFYRVCFAHPAVAAISWWDFSDAGAWVPKGGIVRDDTTPKPVFDRLKNLIKKTWWTEAEGASADEGTFKFHGYYGQYEVSAEKDGKRRTGTIVFTRESKETPEITLK